MSGTSIPYLQTFSPGQGVIPAASLNTFMQGGCYLANLRTFTGLPNQTVQMIGFTAQSDGGQGTFVWSTNTGTDDGGVTTIVPYGVVAGCWLRQIPGYVLSGGSLSGVISSVTNIASLRAQTTTTLTGTVVFVDGYFVGADGGEGIFWNNAADTSSADNGGTIIVDASSRRWYREASGAQKNIRWFGGNPSVADCTSAYVAALASLTTNGGVIFFPKGVYTFLSSPSYTYPATTPFSVAINGEGQDVTTLSFPSGSGFSFSASSPLHTVHLRNFTCSTSAAGGSTVGISLTNSVQGGDFGQNDVINVTFRGADGGALTDYWNTSLSVTGWGNFTHTSCVFYGPTAGLSGIGVSLQGVASGGFKYSLIHNFNSCSWFNLAEGLVYGTYVQGVTVSQCNFTNGTTDILIPAGAVGCVQLTITGSQFAGSGERIILNGALASLLMSSNLIFVAANQIGLALNAIYGQVSIIGNNFSGMSVSGSFGINVNATGYTCVVTGNVFYGLGNGINLLGASTGGWIVALNNYSGSTNTVLNVGSNTVGTITQ